MSETRGHRSGVRAGGTESFGRRDPAGASPAWLMHASRQGFGIEGAPGMLVFRAPGFHGADEGEAT